jgi:hypothetical protein
MQTHGLREISNLPRACHFVTLKKVLIIILYCSHVSSRQSSWNSDVADLLCNGQSARICATKHSIPQLILCCLFSQLCQCPQQQRNVRFLCYSIIFEIIDWRGAPRWVVFGIYTFIVTLTLTKQWTLLLICLQMSNVR